MTTTAMSATDVSSRYRRPADYAAAAMIYLKDNVLLREPLRREHLKRGCWGTGERVLALRSHTPG